MKFEDAFIVGTINSSDNISDKKTKIKKLVKANIDKNDLLKEFLEVNRIKGEFIKEATNAALRNDVRGYRDGTLADKILDTHLGSGSIAIACHDYGFELTACELDTEYYNNALKRLQQHQAQLQMF